jgi:hypothetical protein
MPQSRLLLIGTALAFAAWISYLFYLTRQVERPSIVLSRPQFLIAEAVIVAHVEKKEDPVTVVEVIFDGKLQSGEKVRIRNLRDSLYNWVSEDKTAEWALPSDFIIPLHDVQPSKDGAQWIAEVVPIPPSPGLPHGFRIYPKTPGTIEQVRAISIGTP